MRTRERNILKMPDVGGQPCPAQVLSEVEPCAMHECQGPCYDGKFGPWGDWSQCSASCAGGVTFRSRKIAKMANSCGQEPEGKDREEKFCNVDAPCEASQDCVLAPWSAWSDCSASCSGVKRRSRIVAQYGRGSGSFCESPLKETAPCNPDEGIDLPEKCLPAPNVDCEFTNWEPWSECSASCGGGQHVRSRSIAKHPQHYGKACSEALAEIAACAQQSCGGPKAVDCSYGDWQDWNECAKCDGERKRQRVILAHAAHGGRGCEPFATEEIGNCPRACDETTYCSWNAWSEWGRCSKPCGTGGQRLRTREIQLSHTPPEDLWEHAPSGQHAQHESRRTLIGVDEVHQEYEVLTQEMKDMEEHRIRELSVAFAAGCVTLLFAMASFHCMQTRSDRRSARMPSRSVHSLMGVEDGNLG